MSDKGEEFLKIQTLFYMWLGVLGFPELDEEPFLGLPGAREEK